VKTDYIGRVKSLLRKIIPGFVLGWYHLAWAVLGAALYGFPARKMTVIGVTGTDGKSTTVEMITRIFEEAGYKTCSTSSVWFQIDEKKEKNHLKMGMPGRMFLQKFLRDAAKQGCTHAVIEVSSEGILQNRHKFLNFHTAVITNLSPEHIEHHGSFEKYRAEKQKLFKETREVHVLNGDDENVEYFSKLQTEKKFFYGMQSHAGHVVATDIQEHRGGTDFQVNGTKFPLQLIGQFNTYNALAAICVALAHGISMDVCKNALAKMPRMPGRTEPVITDPFTVLIDYAVTPKAFENLYKGVRRLFEPKKMICVFGACGGGRDKWKRPILGKIASSYCDQIILTNEDPYDENPDQILDQIAEGTHGKAQKVPDRREAIQKALSVAQEGDVVVVSGKGSEDAIAIAGGKKIAWDERKVVEEEFAKLYKSA
jgi:UDP-N-acetylmuramoyl-L-alanyl-D-glutamate--2,6-diaminopimelate ligase